MAIVADRTAILDAAEELWGDRDHLQRDEVDGYFYWKFCRTNFIKDMESSVEHSDMHLLNADAAIDMFRQFDSWRAENPSLITSIYLNTSPVMRGAYFYHGSRSLQSGRGEHYISAGITAGDWSGERVEREIRSYAERTNAEAGAAASSRTVPGFAIRFEFLKAGAPLSRLVPGLDSAIRSGTSDLLTKMPVLVVEATVPLPPPSVIALIYEDTVIDKKQWNLLLSPRGNGQGVDIAIRTWATALLAATGRKLHLAMGDVDERLGTNSSGERVYQRHRKELFKRVPEAATFLGASTRSDF